MLRDVGNCAMMPIARGWDQREYTGGSSKRMGKLGSAFEEADTSPAYLYGAIYFIPSLGIRFLFANSCRGGAESLRDSHRMGVGRIVL
jgi:hypothetical protein